MDKEVLKNKFKKCVCVTCVSKYKINNLCVSLCLMLTDNTVTGVYILIESGLLYELYSYFKTELHSYLKAEMMMIVSL